ncbi:lipopolysaccharide biosynthesis protein, partial [Phocaeicola sp.]
CAAIADFLNMLGSLGALIVIWLLTLVTPKGNLLAIALTFSIVPVVVLMIAYIIVFGGKYRSISPSVKYIKFKYTKDLVGLGIKFFIVQAAALILFTTSNFIITQLFGPSEVTMYNIAFKYFSIATMAFTVLMAPMWNAYTEAYVRGDYIWMRNAFHKTLLIWGSIVLCSVLMLVFSRWAYELWVGVKVASQIPISLSIGCTLFVTIANWGNVTAMLLNGIGKIQIQLIVGSLMAVLYIPLSVLMGNYIGVAGVLYALCVVSLPGAILGMVQVNKILNRTAGGVWAK